TVQFRSRERVRAVGRAPPGAACAVLERPTMKRSRRLFTLCLLASSWLGPGIASAQESRPEQQTLSPYFLVEDADPSVDQLPLKDTRVEVTVVVVIADVTVRAVHEHQGHSPIHARR